MKYEKIEDWSEVEWSEVKNGVKWSEEVEASEEWSQVKKARSEEWSQVKKWRSEEGKNEWRNEEVKNEWRNEEVKMNRRSQEVKMNRRNEWRIKKSRSQDE